jgi:hypothetical protein
MPPSERLGEYLRRGSSLAPALLAVDDLGCPIYWREVRFLSPNPLVVGGRVSAGLYRSAQVRLGGGTSGSNPLCSSDESIANPTAVALAGNIIIDDPLKPDEAFSDARRQGCNEWYDHTLYSRQNDKRCGAIIIMQRLHEDDLVGNFDHKTPRSAQPSRGEFVSC